MKALAARLKLRWPAGHDESGVAMVVVIGIGLIVFLFSAVAFELSNTSLTRSSSHVGFETALHLSEHGTDQTLARLQKDKTWSTTDPSTGLTHEIPSGLTAQQE